MVMELAPGFVRCLQACTHSRALPRAWSQWLDSEIRSMSGALPVGAGAVAIRERAGSHQPATAPPSESRAETVIAAANPAVKFAGELPVLLAEKAATRSATPNTPPRNRPMLKMPDALPISTTATELS